MAIKASALPALPALPRVKIQSNFLTCPEDRRHHKGSGDLGCTPPEAEEGRRGLAQVCEARLNPNTSPRPRQHPLPAQDAPGCPGPTKRAHSRAGEGAPAAVPDVPTAFLTGLVRDRRKRHQRRPRGYPKLTPRAQTRSSRASTVRRAPRALTGSGASSSAGRSPGRLRQISAEEARTPIPPAAPPQTPACPSPRRPRAVLTTVLRGRSH